ncbi:MAG: LysR family transcriptional regulator [Rhodobacteraceae bacterium]|nr:LysR family transcriptional regulator [Paracoccaceae bacterium]
MNWSSLNFDWNQVRAFLATVEEGSLSAAARALGQSQPTLGRQVAALEEDLGVVLFERVGRSLSLTPAGTELLEHVRAMGEAASRISLAASGQSQTVDGHVCISASDMFSAYLLPPILKKLRIMAPGILVRVEAVNTISDLQRREADIAIRHVRPEQPDLIAKLLGDATGSLYAATSYLDAVGRPKTVDDLADAVFIGFDDPVRMVAELNAAGLPFRVENARAYSSSGIAAWEMVRHGLGMTVMADSVGATTPGIERVLPDLPRLKFPVWLTVHRELHTSRRIRLVFDLLAEEVPRTWLTAP